MSLNKSLKASDKTIICHMSSSLGTWLKKCAPEEAQRIRKRIIEELNKLLYDEAEYLDCKPIVGVPRLRAIMSRVDMLISSYCVNNTHLFNPSCQPGCSGCCHLSVFASDEEVRLCLDTAAENGFKIDLERLKLQQGAEGSDLWKTSPETSKCVFLGDDNKCAVYKDRPIACRLHIALDGGSACYQEAGQQQIKYLLVIEAEVLNAAYKTFHDIERSDIDKEGYTFPPNLHEGLYALLVETPPNV